MSVQQDLFQQSCVTPAYIVIVSMPAHDLVLPENTAKPKKNTDTAKPNKPEKNTAKPDTNTNTAKPKKPEPKKKYTPRKCEDNRKRRERRALNKFVDQQSRDFAAASAHERAEWAGQQVPQTPLDAGDQVPKTPSDDEPWMEV